MRKILLMFLATVVLIIAGCSESESSNASGDSDYPKKDITLLIAYEAGGGTDTGARVLQSYLEDELGVTVNIENKPGGAGWVAWSELANAKPDGYTIGYINSPNIITGYLDPKYKRDNDLEDFQFIANHVLDPGIVAIRTDEDRFSDFDEMIEYAQEHELTATTSGVGSNDHMAILLMNNHYDTNITPVHTDGAAEGSAQVIGGHTDLFVAKTGEVVNHVENGELKAISVNSEEGSPFLEDVPTTEELGYPEIVHRSARGIAAPKGVPDDVLEVLSEAFEKAIENEEQVEKMSEQGLGTKYLTPDDYYEYMQEDEQQVKDLSDLLGY